MIKIILGNPETQLREVRIEVVGTDVFGVGWTLSQAQADLKSRFSQYRDEFDLMNMLKY